MSAVEQEAKIKDLQAKLQNFDNPTPQPSNSGILKSLLSELYVEGSLWLTNTGSAANGDDSDSSDDDDESSGSESEEE